MNELKPDFSNPLGGLGHEDAALLSPEAFSAVCARPGVGKTAFLVQLALWAMSLEKNVLHVSLRDPIKKVDLWYQDLCASLARRSDEASPGRGSVFPRRFIMTFKVEGFSVPKLEERMADLMEQNIFTPQVILLDGLETDTFSTGLVEDLKSLARRFSAPVWISLQIQQYPRAEDPSPVPAPLQAEDDAFKSIVFLEGTADQIQVKSVKGASGKARFPFLRLDPSTLLLTTVGSM